MLGKKELAFNLESKQQIPFGMNVASELAHGDPLDLLGWGYDLFLLLFHLDHVRSEVYFFHSRRQRLVIVGIPDNVW